jgi:hypothetical protein
VRQLVIKGTCSLTLLLSLTLGHAQETRAPAANAEYTGELVRLLTGLQKNPWLGWSAGTEVTIRYFVERDAKGKPLGHKQPDLIYKVIDTEKRFEITQQVNGKLTRREFLVKNEQGLDIAGPRLTDPASVEYEMDSFKLPALMTEIVLTEIPGSRWITNEWVLASHPSIVLRKEVNGNGWKVSSARVTKTVGGREFSCVKIKKRMFFYHQGPAELATLQYLCPDVPGHMVEEIQYFVKIKQGPEGDTPFQVVHKKVVEIKAISLR